MKFLLFSSSSLLLLLLHSTSVDARLRKSAAATAPARDETAIHQGDASSSLLLPLPRVRVVRQRQLQEEGGDLVGLGGDPHEREYPLQLCEGDCDEDTDVSEAAVGSRLTPS